jgi:hypothetical protein
MLYDYFTNCTVRVELEHRASSLNAKPDTFKALSSLRLTRGYFITVSYPERTLTYMDQIM